jgi:endogenous inhibitor of DNA gyrase (YacG/DUF329 family)
MIDLGAWATEAYRVPQEDSADNPGGEDAGDSTPPRN